jgi:uncharacterized protein (TIGR02118 family)
MAKIVCTIQRLDHLDGADFRRYYEDNHAPLALQYMPFTRYSRSYPVGGGSEGLGFDVIPEFWLEDASAVGTILSGPAGKVLAEDEARFFHRDRVAAAPVDEFILARPNIELGSVRPRKALLIRAETSRREAIRGAVFDWACSFSKPARELVLDFVTAVNEPAFPADVVVWSDATVEPPALAGTLSLWKTVEVETAETAADKLLPVAA